MFIIITSFAVSLLFTASTSTQKNETCHNLPNSENGTCIPIAKCPYAHQLIMIHDIQYLQRLTCGFDGVIPLVCCPSHLDDNQIKFNNASEEATTRPISRPTSTTPQSYSTPKLYNETTKSTENDTKLSYTTTEVSTNDQSTPLLINVLPKESIVERQPVFNDPVPLEPSPAFKNSTTEHQTWTRDSQLLLLPDRKVCGDNSFITERIYGGELADIGEFPWIARLKVKHLISNKESYVCAGSLISNRYVVTAGHCVIENSPIISVRLGEWDTETERDCSMTQYCNDPPVDIPVESVIKFPHPEDSSKLKDIRDDVALLRLSHPVNFTEFIKPICLPTSEYVIGQDYIPESMYLTAGWGRTETSKASTVLQKVQLPAVSLDICKVAVPFVPENQFSYVICAGGRKGIDSCVGDSGGGLFKAVTEEKQTNWYLFGITSYGSGRCGSEGIPSIYTRVASYMDWILSNLKP